MAQTNQQHVGKALELLREGLADFIQREFQSKYGDQTPAEALHFLATDPVRSKVSCGIAAVEFQQASKMLAGLDLANCFTDSILLPGKENHVPFALVVPFPMKMRDVI